MVEALEALRAVITRRTLAGPGKDDGQFDALHDDLRRFFPRLFATCEQVALPDHALLLRWPGHDPQRSVVLMAHQDVVPINPDDTWTHPPFDAVVADGFLWGRGTLDCKGSLIAICAAVEELILEEFVPAGDVWLSFGSDEEVTGHTAPAAVEALAARGVDPLLVIDEGGAVAAGAFPTVSVPLALVGIAEKGYSDVQITANAPGGHASMPPRRNAPAVLAKAIMALQRHPAPSSLGDATVAMLEQVAPHAGQPLRQVVGRAGSIRPALARTFARLGPETAAMVRTTYAVTTLTGSPARNVLASTASATVNLRIAIGESVDQAVGRLRRTVGKDVEVSVLTRSEPTPTASTTGEAFALIQQACARELPEAVVVPYVVMATTDARHFQQRWRDVYRFTPFRMSPEQRGSLHNVDERLEIDSFATGVRWYRALLEKL
ncbi:M20/M25/M40 family metallo-hydrolase [Calidifontibacter terrae]